MTTSKQKCVSMYFLSCHEKFTNIFVKHRVIEISRFWLNSSHFVLQNGERFWRIPVIERAKRIIPFFNRKVPLTINSSFIVFSEQIAHLCRLHLFFLLSFNQDHFSQWLTHTEIQYYFYFHQNKSTSNFELVFLRYCTIYSGVFFIKIQSKWLFYQRTEWSFIQSLNLHSDDVPLGTTFVSLLNTRATSVVTLNGSSHSPCTYTHVDVLLPIHTAVVSTVNVTFQWRPRSNASVYWWIACSMRLCACERARTGFLLRAIRFTC